MIGIIYKITNSVNGKIYIGQTIEKNPFRRIKRHFQKSKNIDLVYSAYLKYGDVFHIDLLYSTKDMYSLNEAEKYFINYYNCLIPNGYNIKIGGNQGGMLTNFTKIKISKAVKEYYKNNVHPYKGKKFSQPHRNNLSKVRKGFTSIARKEARFKSAFRYKVYCLNLKTNIDYCFLSIKDACEFLDLISSCVSKTINNKDNRTQHKGFIFKFINKALTKKRKSSKVE